MAHIPIDLPEQSVHVHAQRELAFEVMTSFGAGGGGMGPGEGGPPTVVIQDDGDSMLVEFRTALKFGPIATTWMTTERVTPARPVSIDFKLVPAHGIVTGGLRELNDQITFEKRGNCTLITYKSRFGIRWSIGGWLLGKVVIVPIIRKHMIEHLSEVKAMIEDRASKSRVHPQLACDEDADATQADGAG